MNGTEENKLEDLEISYYKLKKEIRLQRRRVNKELREDHKLLFRCLDLMVILMILANIGAFIITKALVVKADPSQKFYEVNPATSDRLELEKATNVFPKDKVYGYFMGFFINVFVYFGLISWYLSFRFRVTSYGALTGMASAIFLGFLLLFLDFANDLGYLIGKIIWGT